MDELGRALSHYVFGIVGDVVHSKGNVVMAKLQFYEKHVLFYSSSAALSCDKDHQCTVLLRQCL